MSEVRPDIDLEAFARPSSVPAPRARWRRLLLPLGIVVAFAAVLGSTLTDLFLPVVDVTVARPSSASDGSGQGSSTDTVLLQAAGWLEPDPFPIQVTALAGGIVQELLVQESDVVEAGDPIAQLVDEDARLAQQRVLAELARAQAELVEAEATDRIAEESYDAALGVTEREAVTHAMHEGKVAEAEHRTAAVRQGEARLVIAEGELVVQEELETAGVAGTRQVEIAAARVQEGRGLLDLLHADAALASAEAESAKAAHERALADVEHRFEDRLAVDVARARVDRARAEVARIEALRDEASLRLERMVVRAPVGGVVLELLTVPGGVVDSSVPTWPVDELQKSDMLGRRGGVCTLYDPDSLRVRVDVPEQDVERIRIGQRAEIDATSRPRRPYTGEVIRLVRRADIQKQTLEAQVRVTDGDALLHPDLLAQVRFYGTETGASGDEASARESAVLVPRRLIDGDAVWVVDGKSSLATRRRVELGGSRGDLVEVRRGLNLTDKLIDEGRASLSEGIRVRVKGGL